MKLISLNIWAGKVFDPLMDFLKSNKDIDIFCFQEVYDTEADLVESRGIRANVYREIGKILQGHQGYFTPVQDGHDYEGPVGFHLRFGNAIFLRKDIDVVDEGDIFICGTRNSFKEFLTEKWKYMPRNLSYVQFKFGDELATIFNFHGLWDSKGKIDTDDRIIQSKDIKDFMSKFTMSKNILCGDFNILPDTKSISILDEGMKNLIKDFNITSTRSGLYTKPDKFADYIFTSEKLHIKDFKVLQDEVSDHLPLFLNFDLK